MKAFPFLVTTITTLSRYLPKQNLQHVLYRACGDFDHAAIAKLLLLGADPFWQHPEGFTCITKAARSSVDTRNKMRVFQSEKVSY